MEKLMTKNKHDHSLTDILKVLVFAIFLVLPFLCFLPTGLYYGFNEHATNETTTQINYKYQSNEVNTLADLVEGNIYEFYFNSTFDNYFSTENSNFSAKVLQTYNYDFTNYSDDITLDDKLVNFDSILQGNTIDYFNVYDNNGYFDFYINSEYDYFASILIGNLTDYNFTFHFIGVLENFTGIQNISFINQTDYNVIESVETNVQDTISNKMYLAWEGVWTSPLFNWTSNTPLNTSLNGFISIFGINTNSYIGNALIWLLSITAIYVVIDIVIGVFKWLTHLIGNK